MNILRFSATRSVSSSALARAIRVGQHKTNYRLWTGRTTKAIGVLGAASWRRRQDDRKRNKVCGALAVR
jgi:hypothetical protein